MGDNRPETVIEVASDGTVRRMKMQVEAATGIPASTQQLVLLKTGQALNDDTEHVGKLGLEKGTRIKVLDCHEPEDAGFDDACDQSSISMSMVTPRGEFESISSPSETTFRLHMQQPSDPDFEFDFSDNT